MGSFQKIFLKSGEKYFLLEKYIFTIIFQKTLNFNNEIDFFSKIFFKKLNILEGKLFFFQYIFSKTLNFKRKIDFFICKVFGNF